MAKIINSCYECAHHYGYYCSHPSRDKSVYATKIQLPHVGIPADCPRPDAPDATRVKQLEANTHWLITRIDEIHAILCPDKNGAWQERATQVVEAAGKVQADIARLTEENARLREALEK